MIIVRQLRLFLISFILTLFFISCSNEVKELYIFNWGEYIDESVLADFEKEFAVKIHYETYASNEEMYDHIKGGGRDYDLACPSDYMIERMAAEDMLAVLDHENIPNMKLIDTTFLDLPFDKKNNYSVPYMWGTLGILYNTNMVDHDVNSWSELWKEENRGKIGMYNSSRDSLAVALKLLGYSLNSTNTKQIETAKQLLIEQKPLVYAYGDDNLKDMITSGEIAMAVVYSGDYGSVIEDYPHMAYAVPEEGSNIWFDNWVIMKDSPRKELAEKFINFLCREEIAFKNTDYVGYATPISSVKEMLPDDVKNDVAIYPPPTVINNCEVYIDLKDFTDILDRTWTEIRASN